jgi:hypothetical protein
MASNGSTTEATMGRTAMKYMLCRNEVRDYDTWRRLFDADAGAHRAAGLDLKQMWRDRANANNVFFLSEVESLKMAHAFIDAPDAKARAEKSGVIGGEYHFLDSVDPY